MKELTGLRGLGGVEELGKTTKTPETGSPSGFGNALLQAVESVDALQKQSESAQAAYAAGEPVELHEVLMKVEEAEVTFRAMMQIRTKLVEAYQQVMRMGS